MLIKRSGGSSVNGLLDSCGAETTFVPTPPRNCLTTLSPAVPAGAQLRKGEALAVTPGRPDGASRRRPLGPSAASFPSRPHHPDVRLSFRLSVSAAMSGRSEADHHATPGPSHVPTGQGGRCPDKEPDQEGAACPRSPESAVRRAARAARRMMTPCPPPAGRVVTDLAAGARAPPQARPRSSGSQ